MTHITMTAETLAQAQTTLQRFVTARSAYREAQAAYATATAANDAETFAALATASREQEQALDALYPVATNLHIAQQRQQLSADEAALYSDMVIALRDYYGGHLPWAL